MGLHSRYVSERFLYPSPLDDRDAFVRCVLEEAGRAGNPVLFAFSDSTLVPLVNVAHHDVPWSWLLPSSLDCFEVASDKASTLELARALGIDVPATYSKTTGDGLPAFMKDHGLPLVVKPSRSVFWNRENGNRGIQISSSFATSPEDLLLKCDAALRQTGKFPLVQEYVSGEEASVQFLCDRGAVLVASSNRRLRSVSPLGGPGALKETIPLSYHGLAELGRRLAVALKWSGPMMVEFKIDRQSGVPKLMEINGRFWGSLPLAVFAGVDFPYLYYRLAQGLEVERCKGYYAGVVSRHFMGDLHHLCFALFKRDPMRALAYPKRRQAILDFLRLPRGCKSDVLDHRDVMPAFAEVIDTAARIYRRSFKPSPELPTQCLLSGNRHE